MRVLITGVAGFVGRALAQHLATAGSEVEIWGLVWPADPARPPEHVRAVPGDLTDRSSLTRAIVASRPEIVYHLAAATSVASSWQHPQQALEVNLAGSVNLFEALRQQQLDPIVVVASSAEIYGAVPESEQPISETAPLRPLSPYGASKAALDLAVKQLGDREGLRAVRLRLFNHTGPGRPQTFVASSFARQIARIERGLDPPRLAVGNLDAVRDFTDVRDVVGAYRLAASPALIGQAFNICSGRGISIRQLLDRLLDLTELDIEVSIDPGRLRAHDIPRLVGSPRSFADATGWQAEISLQQTLHDLLDWWRARVEDETNRPQRGR